MPDIEGVPYEAAGTALDVATAQALAARHREAASAGVSAANAAADRSVAASDAARAEAAGAKALSQSVVAEVGTIRTAVVQSAASASAAAASAFAAAGSAAQAEQTATDLVPRVEHIETMAGLAPGEVTDAQTANLITQPDTSTRAALNAAIAPDYVAMPAMVGEGIDPTGQTDSTAAMQAFIDAHPLQSMFIPEGTYLFSRLVLSEGQALIGAGRSTFRDFYSSFGHAGWFNTGYFGGTILRSTAPDGIAVQLVHPSKVTEAGLSNLAVIGPGTGTAIGVSLGASYKSLVNPLLYNVSIGNFATGMYTELVNEGVYPRLIIRGCTTGLLMGPDTNHNVFTGLDIQRCEDALVLSERSYANTFVNPIFQSNAGTAVTLDGASVNAFYNPYLEVNAAGFVFKDRARSNVLDHPFFSGMTNHIRLDAGSEDNNLRGIGWSGMASDVVNAGRRNNIQVGSATITDTGTQTNIQSRTHAGSTLAPWRYWTAVLKNGWTRGDGTADGAYTRTGRTVHFRYTLTLGDGSTASPSLSFRMEPPFPVNRNAQLAATLIAVSGVVYQLHARVVSNGDIEVRALTGADGRTTALTSTYPKTSGLVAGDSIEVTGTYDASA